MGCRCPSCGTDTTLTTTSLHTRRRVESLRTATRPSGDPRPPLPTPQVGVSLSERLDRLHLRRATRARQRCRSGLCEPSARNSSLPSPVGVETGGELRWWRNRTRPTIRRSLGSDGHDTTRSPMLVAAPSDPSPRRRAHPGATDDDSPGRSVGFATTILAIVATRRPPLRPPTGKGEAPWRCRRSGTLILLVLFWEWGVSWFCSRS